MGRGPAGAQVRVRHVRLRHRRSRRPLRRGALRGVHNDAALPRLRERVQPGVHGRQDSRIHAPRQRPGVHPGPPRQRHSKDRLEALLLPRSLPRALVRRRPRSHHG